jgi:hypothetical protein
MLYGGNQRGGRHGAPRNHLHAEAHMNTVALVKSGQKAGAFIVLLACIALSAASIIIASLAQQDFGGVEVSDVFFKNDNGIPVRAKLFMPKGASRETPVPGMVYIHGYQNNRESFEFCKI